MGKSAKVFGAADLLVGGLGTGAAAGRPRETTALAAIEGFVAPIAACLDVFVSDGDGESFLLVPESWVEADDPFPGAVVAVATDEAGVVVVGACASFLSVVKVLVLFSVAVTAAEDVTLFVAVAGVVAVAAAGGGGFCSG